ncbi:hypothetical protein ACV8MV_06430 [Klebsiella oxytoca]
MLNIFCTWRRVSVGPVRRQPPGDVGPVRRQPPGDVGRGTLCWPSDKGSGYHFLPRFPRVLML